MKTVLKTSKNVLVEGPMNVTLMQGTISIFNGSFEQKRDFTVLQGRCLPIETAGAATLKLQGTGTYRETARKIFPVQWHTAAEKFETILEKKAVPKALIIGDINTGKSSLALFLLNTLIKKTNALGIIDADVGQSKIGPPGTIGSAIVSKQITSLYNTDLHDAYFVGDKTPSGHLLQMVTGVKTLSERLASQGEPTGILVDSTGMIYGGPARALKRHKIELLSPHIIFTLEKHRDVDHIIRDHPEETFFRVPVPTSMKPVSRTSRIALRKTSFKRFTNAVHSEMSLNLKQTRIQQSLLRNGYAIPKALVPLPDLVEWAEVSTEGLLIITSEPLEDYFRENIIHRFKQLVKTLQGVETIETLNIVQVDQHTRNLLELVKGVDPSNLRSSILPTSFYDGLLVGLQRNKALYAIGRIQNIAFHHETIQLEAYPLTQGTRQKIPLPATLILGWLKFDSEWEEQGHRRVGTG